MQYILTKINEKVLLQLYNFRISVLISRKIPRNYNGRKCNTVLKNIKKSTILRRKTVILIISLFILSMLLYTGTTVFADSGAQMVAEWSQEALNCGESVGGNTGGAGYADAEGGYRTLIHGVNEGVRPIKDFTASGIKTNGEDIVLRYRVKILSDDGTTPDYANVFGFQPIIYGDDKKINNEEKDRLVFTAGEVRQFDYDEDGWTYVYYVAEERFFGFSGYNTVKINNQVYYNGASGSGNSIDIAVSQIAVFVGDPREGIAEDTGIELPETVPELPSDIGEFPTPGYENLSGYSFATQDSYKDQGTIAVTAVDGDVLSGSCWVSGASVKKDLNTGLYANPYGSYPWLCLEFEIPTTIDGARIIWGKDCGAIGYYKLFISDDKENFTEIKLSALKRQDGDGSPSSPITDTITFEPVTARYFKLEIYATSENGPGSVYEFELYGDPQQYAFLSRKEQNSSQSIASASDGSQMISSAYSAGTIDEVKTGFTAENGIQAAQETNKTSYIGIIAAVAVLLVVLVLLILLAATGKIKKSTSIAMFFVLLSATTAFSLYSCEKKPADVTSSDTTSEYDTSAESPDDTSAENPDDTSTPQEGEIIPEENVRDGWLLEGIPSYEGGILSKGVYNCGTDLSSDTTGYTSSDSFMQTVARTSADEFVAYSEKLSALGYKKTFESTTEENIYIQYEGGGKLIYAYYINSLSTAKIIDDRSSDANLSQFSYTCDYNGSTKIYQFGLYQAGNTHTTMDCGMIYIIKQSDNSLFVIDGGHQFQATDAATDELMSFMHEITETAEDERITISAWFITHAHADHLMLAAKLLHRYHDEIDLERVMFNFPSFQTVKSGYRAFPTTWFKHIVTTYYDNAVFMKPHTGMNFNLGDLQIEVMYTHEDAVTASRPSSCSVTNFNSTSTVLKITINQSAFMLLGDTDTEAEAIITSMYRSPDTFKSDIVQVSHHAFNYLRTLYNWIAPELALVPNSRSNATSSTNLPKLADVIKFTGEENVYYEGDGTYGFNLTDDGWELVYEAAVVGGPYDGSGM